jgi:hypothetical protein
MEANKYLAAVLDLKDGYWKLTGDYDKVINAAENEVIFVTNLDDLKVELQARSPVDHPKLKRAFSAWANTAQLEHRLVYAGTDVNEFVDILATDDSLNRAGLGVEDRVLATHLSKHHLEHGLVLYRPTIGTKYRYDPEYARKRTKQRAYNKRRLGISVYNVRRAGHAMHYEVAKHFPFQAPPAAGWKDAVAVLCNRVAAFNLLFGKNAHRRFKPFQELLDKWKAADDLGKRRIRDEYGFDKFAGWLDAECKARRRPASETWTPKKLVKPY